MRLGSFLIACNGLLVISFVQLEDSAGIIAPLYYTYAFASILEPDSAIQYAIQAPTMLDNFFKSKNPPKQGMMELEEPTSLKESLPWVEKYRPSTLDQLVSQDQVKRSLTGVLKSGNLPHLLLYGPAGTGKTSAMLALIKQLYGPDYRKFVLELNASDERGINVVRNKIKSFAQKVVSTDKTKNIPKYNIVILDEADSMTNDAQSALRRIMEDYSKTTRFAIICNYVTKIIEPIASRCVKFRFKPIPEEQQLTKLKEICEKENLRLEQGTIRTILSNGDLRKSINTLQTLQGINIIPQIIPTPQQKFTEIFEQLYRLEGIRQVATFAKKVSQEQIPFDELLIGFMRENFKIDNELKKAQIAEVIAKADERVNLGCGEIQLLQLFSTIFFILHRAK